MTSGSRSCGLSLPEPSRGSGAPSRGSAAPSRGSAPPGPCAARAVHAVRAVRTALGAVALVVLLAAIAGCGGPTEPTVPSASPSGAIGVPATSAPATPGSATPSPATSSSPATSAPPSAPIVVDPTLLALLPAQVDGVALKPAPEAAVEMTADAYLGISASAIAVGIVATGSATGDDFASVSVVRLRPGVYSEAFFEAWRQSYDAAACALADGVASHRRQVIGAHTVEVTLCTGGARTLHVHLAGDLLISITTVGDRGFGDLVLAGLRE